MKSRVSFIQLKTILDIFLHGFSLSSSPHHSLRAILLLNLKCLLKYVLNCKQNISFFILLSGLSDIMVNFDRISEGFLYYSLSLSTSNSVRWKRLLMKYVTDNETNHLYFLCVCNFVWSFLTPQSASVTTSTACFSIKKFAIMPYTVLLCVPYDSHNKRRLFP
jgi:hypothetical protein